MAQRLFRDQEVVAAPFVDRPRERFAQRVGAEPPVVQDVGALVAGHGDLVDLLLADGEGPAVLALLPARKQGIARRQVGVLGQQVRNLGLEGTAQFRADRDKVGDPVTALAVAGLHADRGQDLAVPPDLADRQAAELVRAEAREQPGGDQGAGARMTPAQNSD